MKPAVFSILFFLALMSLQAQGTYFSRVLDTSKTQRDFLPIEVRQNSDGYVLAGLKYQQFQLVFTDTDGVVTSSHIYGRRIKRMPLYTTMFPYFEVAANGDAIFEYHEKVADSQVIFYRLHFDKKNEAFSLDSFLDPQGNPFSMNAVMGSLANGQIVIAEGKEKMLRIVRYKSSAEPVFDSSFFNPYTFLPRQMAHHAASILLCGEYSNQGQTAGEFYLKLDSNATILDDEFLLVRQSGWINWSAKFSGDTCFLAGWYADEHYVASGDILVVAIHPSEGLLWEQRLSLDNKEKYYDERLCFLNANQEHLVVGWTSILDTFPPQPRYLTVAKLWKTGVVQFMKTTDAPIYKGNSPSRPLLASVYLSNDGNIVLAGNAYYGAYLPFLICTSTWGNFNSIKEETPSTHSNLLLYPNPATSTLNISLREGQIASCTFMDMQGREISTFKGGAGEALSISTAHLPRGMYLVRLQTVKGESIVQKVLLQ